jgi:S1-C subfamily serine protease
MRLRKILVIVAALILTIGGAVQSGLIKANWSFIERFITIPNHNFAQLPGSENVRVINEESVVIDVVDKASPSVVTVGVTQTRRLGDIFEIDPFDPFSPFRRRPGQTQQIEQDIGSGFIVSSDGLIITNKHVVSDTEVQYRVITKDDTTYDAAKIYRDPSNDLAIIKINPQSGKTLSPVTLGDSDQIKVGQTAIAIGTALGEFRHTVTVGVISGMGRGITAGSPFEGFVERLDNVIQTDAAINPGNSGGPLLNSSGQVIGVNTAVSSNAENVGFAIPINVVKDALSNFNATGHFNRPYLGVRYRIVTRDLSVLNTIPEGAYILEVIENSPAQRAGLLAEDIVIEIDGQKISSETELGTIIGTRKVGDVISLRVWRNESEITLKATLSSSDE